MILGHLAAPGLLIAVLFVGAVPCALSQVRVQRNSTRAGAGTRAQPYKGLIVSLHGSVKKVTKKELLLESDEKQLITIRCSKKTRFWSGNEEIKPSAVDLESDVTIDATEDADLKLLAINVRVDHSPTKTFAK
jgi:hypothetical protein